MNLLRPAAHSSSTPKTLHLARQIAHAGLPQPGWQGTGRVATSFAQAILILGRQGKLGALMWSTSEPQALPAWLGQDSVRDLARQLPCLWDAASVARWPENVQEALAQSGMQAVDPATVAECASAFSLPPGKEWAGGDWYLQPPGKPSSAQAASRTHAMRLVQLVAAEAETHEIEEVFRHDATLSYQLLRLVNSAGMSTGRVVTSFAQAILILGRQQPR